VPPTNEVQRNGLRRGRSRSLAISGTRLSSSSFATSAATWLFGPGFVVVVIGS
jgi:hypothetical protein